jgi:hypothetical protein
MKVYKVEIMIIDHDDLGDKEIKDVIENTRYPNHCINPYVIKTESRDIGEWTDDHPLNMTYKWEKEYHRIFSLSPKAK